MSSNPQPVLEALFTPDGLREFFEAHWPDKYFVAHGKKARLPPAFLVDELNNFDSLARRYQGKVSFFSGPRSPHMVPVEGVNAAALYRLGLSVYLTDIGPYFPEFTPMLRHLERELGINEGCARAGVFASPHSDGIHCHYDAVDIISVQLRGNKLWRLARVQEIPFPSGKQYIPGNHPIDDLYPQVTNGFPDWRDANFDEVEVWPGSVLFMPRGTWHQTEASEDSIAVSIGMTPPTAAEVILEQLRLTLLQDPKWRKPLYGAWGEGKARQRAEEEAHKLIADLSNVANDLSPTELKLSYQSEQTRIAEISSNSRFQRMPNSQLNLEDKTPDDGNDVIKANVVQSHQGASRIIATIDVPRRYGPVLRWIGNQKSDFHLKELTARFAEINSGEAIELAQVLASANVLKLLWFPKRETRQDKTLSGQEFVPGRSIP